MKGLTARQSQVLGFIRRHMEAEQRPPTRREIALHFGWSSANAAEDHLKALKRKGALVLDGGLARGIWLR